MRLRLPATSANLGPAFDAAALALELRLAIEVARNDQYEIAASGRDAEECGRVEGNLIFDTYRRILQREGVEASPLWMRVDNEIPLGMGLGSSAAARLAGVGMASHFGGLGWDRQRLLEEACALEGHADNAAACLLGGFVTVAVTDGRVTAARFVAPAEWSAAVVLPSQPLATAKARAVLPDSVSRQDAVANLQRSALLTAAFAQGRGDWLQEAMRDTLHQPYRAELCPLLPRLLPLAGQLGVLGVALSGAGPAVLLLLQDVEREGLLREIEACAGEAVEVLWLELAER